MIWQTRYLFHRSLLSLYCRLVYSLLSRQKHQYILIKSKAIEQTVYTVIRINDKSIIIDRFIIIRNYSSRSFVTFNITLITQWSIDKYWNMYHGQKKAEFLHYYRSLQALSTKILHRLLLYVEDRFTASSILFHP